MAAIVALIPMTVFPLATAHAQRTGSADLAVSMRWIGSGAPKAKVGELASFAITATNRGPDTAAGAFLGTGVPDQMNPVSLTCSDPAVCGSGADLAPGATVTATLVVQVCCFPMGETRKATVSAFINSQAAEPTPDPDASNNTASVVVRIVGPHGFAG